MSDNKQLSSMEWFKSLNVNTRINMKDIFILLTGVNFSDLNFLLSYRERIDIMYNKLISEGIL